MLVCITLIPLVNAQNAKFGFTAGGTLAWQRNESETGALTPVAHSWDSAPV